MGKASFRRKLRATRWRGRDLTADPPSYQALEEENQPLTFLRKMIKYTAWVGGEKFLNPQIPSLKLDDGIKNHEKETGQVRAR